MIRRDKDPTLKSLLLQEALLARGLYTGDLDNWWGYGSEAAYQTFLQQIAVQVQDGPHTGIASVFADLKDLKAFTACKAKGKTDLECFKVGDNGIGASGRVTAQEVDPMVALHPVDIRAKWGEMSKAWGKRLTVFYGGKSCEATLEDYMSSPKADIDLNPAAVSQLGIPAGGMVPVQWAWV